MSTQRSWKTPPWRDLREAFPPDRSEPARRLDRIRRRPTKPAPQLASASPHTPLLVAYGAAVGIMLIIGGVASLMYTHDYTEAVVKTRQACVRTLAEDRPAMTFEQRWTECVRRNPYKP